VTKIEIVDIIFTKMEALYIDMLNTSSVPPSSDLALLMAEELQRAPAVASCILLELEALPVKGE
jgi:hypothetical protein